MLRKAAITLALTLLPGIAMAQEHTHDDAAKKQHHEHAAAEMSGHADYTQLIMEKRAELKLTDEQIAKLEEMSARMAKHHGQMKKAGARHDDAEEAKLHSDLMAIFTPEQQARVQTLMKAHMDHTCAADGNKQCKVDTKKAELK